MAWTSFWITNFSSKTQVKLIVILKLWAFEQAIGKDIWNQVPDRTALAVKRNGKWVKWTFAEYEEQVKKTISLLFRFIAQCIYISQVRSLAKAFIHLGLKKSHSVCIIGFNAPEWHISCLATVVAGGLTTGAFLIGSKMYLFQLCWIKSESDVDNGQEKCTVQTLTYIDTKLINSFQVHKDKANKVSRNKTWFTSKRPAGNLWFLPVNTHCWNNK